MEQGPFGGDGRLLVQVRSASDAVPGGFSIVISHVGGCANSSRDDTLIQCIRDANPTVMNEIATAAREVMAAMGCPKGCRIDKDNSAGMLYSEHSQDSFFWSLIWHECFHYRYGLFSWGTTNGRCSG